MRRLCVIMAVLGAMLGAAPAGKPGPARIVQPFPHHGEEAADLVDGELWWGLFAAEDGAFELREVPLRVTLALDEMLGETEPTGRVVSVDGEVEPLFLVHNLPRAEAGPVETAFSGYKFLYPGERIYLPVGEQGEDAMIAGGRAELVTSPFTHTEITEYTLNLVRGQGKQELARFERVDEDGPPALLWAGDLDRDGRIDLLLNLTDHYNKSVLTLFLSSPAQNKFLEKAAVRTTTGC